MDDRRQVMAIPHMTLWVRWAKKVPVPINLEFKEISDEFVHKQINKTSVKKATGRDGISAKLLKLAKHVIAKPITKMINKTITNSVFPEQLKQAQVVALHKKNNALDKSKIDR